MAIFEGIGRVGDYAHGVQRKNARTANPSPYAPRRVPLRSLPRIPTTMRRMAVSRLRQKGNSF